MKDIIRNKICLCLHQHVQVRYFLGVSLSLLTKSYYEKNIMVGWVCYAEKAHGFILPYISTAKSPQQIIGTLVKDIAGERGMYMFILLSSRKYYYIIL